MLKTALILIDIQNDYFEGGLKPLEGMDTVAANAALLLNAYRGEGLRIFHIRHIAGSSEAPFFRPGTHGSEIHGTVQPLEGEIVFEKNRPSAFVGTALEQALREVGIDQVTLCGAMSQMCVDATARAAADKGFKVVVVEDACAAASADFRGVSVLPKQVHAAFMAPLAASYGAVLSTQEALRTHAA